MKPICVPCERFMRAKKSGFYFTEGMPVGRDIPPGKVMPEGWTAYKVWVGDQYECPTCLASVIVGVPPQRIAEHYEPNFSEVQRTLGADQFLVKDC